MRTQGKSWNGSSHGSSAGWRSAVSLGLVLGELRSWPARRWLAAAVAALGVSGALSYFEPIQPALGVCSVVLLAATLAVRLRGLAACRVAPAPLEPVRVTSAEAAGGDA